MKKITLLLILAFFKVNAQDSNLSVAVMPFQGSTPENAIRAAQLQEIILEILNIKSNITPIDRSKDLLLNKELDIQINERSIASKKLVEQGKKIGADHLIIGTLTSIEVEQDNNGGILKTILNDNFKANISFSLQIIDVETGRIISHKSFTKAKDPLGLILPGKGTGSTQESAIVDAMQDSKKKILSWLNEVYPSLIKIVKIEERRNGRPRTILVTGIDNSLGIGSKLILEETEIMAGAKNESLKRVKKIATLVIKEKQGDITVCKITDGEELIEEKMNNGSKLSIQILDGAIQKGIAKIQPKIMVIPKVPEDEDIRKYYDSNMDIQVAITVINNALKNWGGKIISYSQVQKEVVENTNLYKSVNSASDYKSMVLQKSNADIYVEVKMQVNDHPARGAKSVTLTLECYQVGTGNILATKAVPGPIFQTEDIGQLTMMAIDKIAEEFLNQMQASFDDILENGQSIFVEFTATQDSKINLDTKINGKRLSRLLDEWFEAHALNNSYNNQGGTDLQIIFSDVKIPVRNPSNPNKNYTGQDLYYEIEEYLDSINVEYERVIGTNNKILISIL